MNLHYSHELAESYFTLWRLTKDEIYREYAWELAQSIHRHSRLPTGTYSDIKNVQHDPTEKANYANHQFLSSTFKFLYLTFVDDTEMPLDKWFFTSAGHPLPICGKHDQYPEGLCLR